LVCTAFWDSISDVPLATPSDGDTTHLSNADQIYDWVIGLGYLTTETDPTLATWAGSTNITTLGTISTGTWNGSTIGLANGGTGASLSDPNDDRILFWDDTAGVVTWLDIGTNLSITGTILDATDTQLSEGAVEAYIFDGDNAGTLSSGTLALDSLGYTGTLDLANGGLGVSLSDPNDDRILFWDDTAGAVEWLDIGTNLSITGTVLDASTVSVYWEDGTNGIFEDDEGVIVGIDQAETLANTGFVLAAGDLFVQDELGVEGDVFTDSSFIAGSSLTLNDAYIRDSGDLVFQADGDTDDYLYFDTTSNEEYLMFEDASLAYGNDPGIRLNSTSGELEYRDENESVWTSLDSLGASAVPNFYSYQDTTADTHVDNDTTDYWDEAAENGNEHPNITPSATSSEVLVIVTIRVHTPNQDRDLVTNVQRNAGSDPTCAAGNEVGPLIAYGRTRDNTNETFSAVFVDNPATTSTVYYTLCSDSETVDEDSNNTIEEIYFTLYEVNNAADLAEVYATSDTTLGIAEVVSLDPELDAGVKRAEGNYNDDVLGIISTKPALAIGGTDNSGKSGVPVALTGRVPVKVTTSNGAIQPGDFLTTSEIPGVAMKATKSGYVIGKALTGLEEGEGVVLVFVERGYKPFTDRLGIVVGEIDSYMSEVVDDVLVIKGDITAYGSLKIEGHLKVSEDTAGSVTIPEGKTEVSVTYRQSYNDTPKVAVTPQGEIKTFYHVRNKTKDGFKIVINRPQTKDVNFDWIVME
ncbi:hypothetical protein JW766_02620, partial [Candidatus Dojkabacteria bacterium]|nr:hypothetical protein [Candidatus Dojkabacteria bacterium]